MYCYGEVNLTQALIYVYADTEIKRAALEKCQKKEENETDKLIKMEYTIIILCKTTILLK